MLPYINILGTTVETYPIMYGLGILTAAFTALYLAKRFGLGLIQMSMLIVSAAASGIVGAALTYALVTYTPAEILYMLKTHSFSVGLVFYGGLVFGAAFTLLIARLLKLNIPEYSRAVIPAIPIGHAIGRIGCFLSGCCYGIELFSTGVRIPVQLIESICLIAVFIVLLHMSLKGRGSYAYMYILMYAPLRFVLEFLRGDEIRGSFIGLSTSQWISLALILCAVTVNSVKKRTHQ